MGVPPVGVKVKGPDVAEVERLSQDVEATLRAVPGTKYVLAERISEGYYTDVRYDYRVRSIATAEAATRALLPKIRAAVAKIGGNPA